jgi:predicted porin
LEKNIRKKSLLSAAVLGAFATNAMATDVTLYGIVDTGLKYVNKKVGDAKKTDTFSMESGIQSGSRWGLKGTEDLGNGYSVGFVLESGFSSDTGAGDKDRLFNRESIVYVKNASYGELAFGRTGAINGVAQTYALQGGLAALGTSWGAGTAYAGGSFVNNGRVDNSITYRSPKFAGFQASVQYSMKMDEKDTTNGQDTARENSGAANRYIALGATYENGPLGVTFIADTVKKRSNDQKGKHLDVDDSFSVALGASYDFGFVKPVIGVQYFKHQDGKLNQEKTWMGAWKRDKITEELVDSVVNNLEGFGVNLGATAPLAGGTIWGGFGYVKADDDCWTETKYWETSEGAEKIKFTRYVGSIGYTYNLSKRTNLYSMASYQQDKYKQDGDSVKVKTTTVFAGLRHQF